jgi:hypothetical protein
MIEEKKDYIKELNEKKEALKSRIKDSEDKEEKERLNRAVKKLDKKAEQAAKSIEDRLKEE